MSEAWTTSDWSEVTSDSRHMKLKGVKLSAVGVGVLPPEVEIDVAVRRGDKPERILTVKGMISGQINREKYEFLLPMTAEVEPHEVVFTRVSAPTPMPTFKVDLLDLNEPPDFEQIAFRIAAGDNSDATGGCCDGVLKSQILGALRQVWNARGAADTETIAAELPPQYQVVTADAIRKLDR